MDLDICIGRTEAASVAVLCLQVGYCRSTAVSCHCFFFFFLSSFTVNLEGCASVVIVAFPG